jgi:DNA mismatch endonuclease (patch repair protein)
VRYPYLYKINLHFILHFSQNKFAYNVERDKKNYKKLEELGWKVIVVWECEIRHGDALKSLQLLERKIIEAYLLS